MTSVARILRARKFKSAYLAYLLTNVSILIGHPGVHGPDWYPESVELLCAGCLLETSALRSPDLEVRKAGYSTKAGVLST
jgi:hypothetical protein